MTITSKTPPRDVDHANVIGPFIEYYRNYFLEKRYQAERVRSYVAIVVRFGDWIRIKGFTVGDIDEDLIGQFLFDPDPRSGHSRGAQRNLAYKKPALNHFIRILREQGVVCSPAIGATEREIALFDMKMIDIWGLSRSTRYQRCRKIARFLRSLPGSDCIDCASTNPVDVRKFVLGGMDSSPSAIRARADAVRCYFRHRELLGDDVRELIRAVPRPAYWRDTSLPEVLSAKELEQLLGAFKSCKSPLRGHAIVQCLVELGLRSSEVVKLRLDDIDWQAGTIRIAAGKTRRADLLPLTAATGEAIANYLRNERPTTVRREIFVRRIAPVGEPIGRGAVHRIVVSAYRRLGWERSRVHILRHTLGGRLVNAGTPMKQIADVLRHRSIATSAIYTRVNVSRLSAVALPWPGSSS